MTAAVVSVRSTAYGEQRAPTVVDRYGIWLSARALRRRISSFDGVHLADIGCGYHASFARSVLDQLERVVLVDVALAPALKKDHRVEAIEDKLPEALDAISDATQDVVLCMSVLEHLADPLATLRHMRRILRPGGTCVINVPTWLGKRVLEFAAFRLGLSPAEEMDDHKTYYDPRDLWPLLVAAGFKPHSISCRRHKFGLNTIAVCRHGVPLP